MKFGKTSYGAVWENVGINVGMPISLWSGRGMGCAERCLVSNSYHKGDHVWRESLVMKALDLRLTVACLTPGRSTFT